MNEARIEMALALWARAGAATYVCVGVVGAAVTAGDAVLYVFLFFVSGPPSSNVPFPQHQITASAYASLETCQYIRKRLDPAQERSTPCAAVTISNSEWESALRKRK